MTTTTFTSYTIDAETVSDITSLPAELQLLAWNLLARYGVSGEVVDWKSSDSMMAYVSGALSRARQRIDAHRTGAEQTMTPAPTQTAQPAAQPTAPTQVIQQTAPTPTLAQATTPETTATAMITPEEMADLARTPEEMKALQRALTPAPVHMSLYGGPTLEDVKSYWIQKGFSGTGLRYWVYYEARAWICKNSKVRNWRLVANSFGSHEKSSWPAKKSTPAKAPAAPAVTQTQTALPANELPLEDIDSDDPLGVIDDGETDTDMDDRINGMPEYYDIDDLLNDTDNDNADTGTAPAATEANPNKMLGCGTAQTGTTPDGHEIKINPDDDDLPF